MPQADGAPVVMAGMVGSAVGWQEVPYADAGVPLAQLGRQLAPLREPPAGRQGFIVPGIRWRDAQGRVDVMRGEETQLIGACRLLGAQACDGWYVLPGTHSKWVRLQQGRVTALRTYMSGELYALLRERGTLSSLMQADGGEWDDALFEQGAAAHEGEALSHVLFGARARVVGGGAPAAGTAAYVSGVLIGAEWRDLQRQPVEGPVRLIGEPALSRLHALCARRWGVATEVLDAKALQLAAWQALQASLEA
jgi:2-dehydro-3-deoxygalactonokinase